ncbi:hypothetical protein SKAU_G00415170 [Synaphobranchus kaupii]|uniref:Uncharacterized protein n=1 Tax=Synaphobranchus kaupii TaxID=118154 RepID=A0A9Q1IBG0_SYNKA|nr:hypothetical protein SKAU_G00415170 [Synaphobranchus kaupii]
MPPTVSSKRQPKPRKPPRSEPKSLTNSSWPNSRHSKAKDSVEGTEEAEAGEVAGAATTTAVGTQKIDYVSTARSLATLPGTVERRNVTWIKGGRLRWLASPHSATVPSTKMSRMQTISRIQ